MIRNYCPKFPFIDCILQRYPHPICLLKCDLYSDKEESNFPLLNVDCAYDLTYNQWDAVEVTPCDPQIRSEKASPGPSSETTGESHCPRRALRALLIFSSRLPLSYSLGPISKPFFTIPPPLYFCIHPLLSSLCIFFLLSTPLLSGK